MTSPRPTALANPANAGRLQGRTLNGGTMQVFKVASLSAQKDLRSPTAGQPGFFAES